MLPEETDVASFTIFVDKTEPQLKRTLCATYGAEPGGVSRGPGVLLAFRAHAPRPTIRFDDLARADREVSGVRELAPSDGGKPVARRAKPAAVAVDVDLTQWRNARGSGTYPFEHLRR